MNFHALAAVVLLYKSHEARSDTFSQDVALSVPSDGSLP